MFKPQINLEDLVGQKFGKLTILCAYRLSSGIYCKCKCDCGNMGEYRYDSLQIGSTKSCGCLHKVDYRSLVGQQFGKLRILEVNEVIKGKRKRIFCKCLCECGTIKEINYDSLRIGETKSCGCSKKSNKDKSVIQHDIRKHLYRIYIGMKDRCYNEKCEQYKYYGMNGIKVCTAWLNKFDNFYKWAIKNNYCIGLTLDRINVNGDYKPSNCRWATRKEQNNNKSNNHYITIGNETKTLAQWCDIYSIKYDLVLSRINKLHWEPEKALTTPAKVGIKYKRRERLLNIWRAMRRRCCNLNDKAYPEYGGRGIIICDEWLNGFEIFKEWAINNGYNDSLSLDRIDVNGNYCPKNCRWITPKEQNRNRRNNKYITINGEKKVLSEWCEIYNIDYKLCHARIFKLKWDPLKALTTAKLNS